MGEGLFPQFYFLSTLASKFHQVTYRGEFLILVGSFEANTTITFIGATGMVLGGCYALWLFNRIAYGNLKTTYCKKFIDLNEREFLIFLPLILGTLIMGIFPNFFIYLIHMNTNKLTELYGIKLSSI